MIPPRHFSLQITGPLEQESLLLIKGKDDMMVIMGSRELGRSVFKLRLSRHPSEIRDLHKWFFY